MFIGVKSVSKKKLRREKQKRHILRRIQFSPRILNSFRDNWNKSERRRSDCRIIHTFPDHLRESVVGTWLRSGDSARIASTAGSCNSKPMSSIHINCFWSKLDFTKCQYVSWMITRVQLEHEMARKKQDNDNGRAVRQAVIHEFGMPARNIVKVYKNRNTEQKAFFHTFIIQNLQ
jgi:hypothetical protein